ncbi:MAG: hypothetical protein D8M58_13675 [Calditrichaeota bacterium]|nr:MAG: hypothetical protein DWQ03_14915 [Calditrichota bacterium]MBL1206449.1 hypothetical protein [Calditrichota bacterium]NOG46276.1 hypothetical protein [Calditrichota bacterium]
MDSIHVAISTLADSIYIAKTAPPEIKTPINMWTHPAVIVAIISIVISILALSVPFILKILKIKSLKKSIYTLLREVQDELIRYKEEYVKLKDQLMADKKGLYFPLLNEAPFYALQKIEYVDLHKIFLQKDYNYERFKSIIIIIEYLKTNEISERNFENYKADLRRYNNEINDALSFILRTFDNIAGAVQRGEVNPEDPFLLGYVEIQKKFRESDDNEDLDTIINIYAEPLKELCKNHLHNHIAVLFLNYAIKISQAHKDILRMNKIYEKFMESSIERINKVIKNLSDSINFYYPKSSHNSKI